MLIVLVCLALLPVVAGCGGEADSKTESTAAAEPSVEPVGEIESVGSLQGAEPKVEPPPRPFPKNLVIRDLRKGSGEKARTGGKATIQFSAVHFDGHPLESSWEFGKPFRLKLGTGELSPGWEKGIPGMRVGGRRELLIPWDMVFPLGPTAGDKPTDGIVYVIDLLEAG